MFCQNCGKQISDDAKFCIGCGTSTTEDLSRNLNNTGNPPMPNRPSVNWNEYKGRPVDMRKTIAFLLMMAATIYVAIGAFLPLITVDSAFYGFVYNSKTLSLFDIFSISKNVKIGGLAFLVLVAATFSYIICIISAGAFLKELIDGAKDDYLTAPVKISMWAGIVYVAIIVIAVSAMNKSSDAEYYGIAFKVATHGWLLLVAALVNIFVLTRVYLNKHATSKSHTTSYDDIVKEKVCGVCKTSYLIGQKCPKCGSSYKL